MNMKETFYFLVRYFSCILYNTNREQKEKDFSQHSDLDFEF